MHEVIPGEVYNNSVDPLNVTCPFQHVPAGKTPMRWLRSGADNSVIVECPVCNLRLRFSPYQWKVTVENG